MCVCVYRIIVEHARSPGSRTAASFDRRPAQVDRYVPAFLLTSSPVPHCLCPIHTTLSVPHSHHTVCAPFTPHCLCPVHTMLSVPHSHHAACGLLHVIALLIRFLSLALFMYCLLDLFACRVLPYLSFFLQFFLTYLLPYLSFL